MNKFRAVPYDIMDVSAKQFDDDFYDFRCRSARPPALHHGPPCAQPTPSACLPG